MAKYILNMGGRGDDGTSNAVDVFEIKNDTVVKRDDINLTLNEARDDLTAASAGHFILAMGGDVNNEVFYDAIDVFEVKGDTVVRRDNINLELKQARSNLSAASSGNFILAMGGVNNGDSNAVDVFEVKNDTVVRRDNINLELKEGRERLAAASSGNFILAMGGFNNGDSNAVDVFEVKGDTVIRRDDISLELKEARYNLATTSVGNFILAMGGRGNDESIAIDVFEVKGNTVVKRDDINLTLKEARQCLAAASVGNFFLAMGGFGNFSFKNEVDVFEVKGNTVVKRDDINLELKETRQSLSVASAVNFILAMGGNDGAATNAVDVFQLVQK